MVLKVVICGGGIGGLTTALCIDRLCGNNVKLEVFEQAPQYKVLHFECIIDARKLALESDSDQMLAKYWISSG
jgi:2-polyprenyl-6-methoxyphenol hydroxylase-like FAD-dependent oxidoreductase